MIYIWYLISMVTKHKTDNYVIFLALLDLKSWEKVLNYFLTAEATRNSSPVQVQTVYSPTIPTHSTATCYHTQRRLPLLFSILQISIFTSLFLWRTLTFLLLKKGRSPVQLRAEGVLWIPKTDQLIAQLYRTLYRTTIFCNPGRLDYISLRI